MARRGRKPQPTELKLLRGVRRDRVNAAAVGAGGRLTAPEIAEDAAAEWARIEPQVRAMGIGAEIDSAALWIYCQAHARWVDANREIERLGLVIQTELGGVKANPAAAIAAAAEATMMRVLAEFGATPSSRSRLTAPAAPEVDELDAFTKRRA